MRIIFILIGSLFLTPLFCQYTLTPCAEQSCRTSPKPLIHDTNQYQLKGKVKSVKLAKLKGYNGEKINLSEPFEEYEFFSFDNEGYLIEKYDHSDYSKLKRNWTAIDRDKYKRVLKDEKKTISNFGESYFNKESFKPEGETFSTTYKYNKRGQVIEEIFKTTDWKEGTSVDTTDHYTYHKNACISENITFKEKGGNQIIQKYEIDAKGRLINSLSLRKLKDQDTVIVLNEFRKIYEDDQLQREETIENSELKKMIKYVYHPDGSYEKLKFKAPNFDDSQAIATYLISADGSIKGTSMNGNFEYTEINNNDTIIQISTRFVDDKVDHSYRTETYKDPITCKKVFTRVFKDETLLEELITFPDGATYNYKLTNNLFNEAVEIVIKDAFIFDDVGNWIERQETTYLDGEIETISVSKRSIEYY